MSQQHKIRVKEIKNQFLVIHQFVKYLTSIKDNYNNYKWYKSNLVNQYCTGELDLKWEIWWRFHGYYK